MVRGTGMAAAPGVMVGTAMPAQAQWLVRQRHDGTGGQLP